MRFEEPIMPPEGDGHGNRYESANLDTEELSAYLSDTVFEDKNALISDLTDRYGMSERESEHDIKMNMTREFDKDKIAKMIQQAREGVEEDEYYGEPLSGEEPSEILNLSIRTTEGHNFVLHIYKIMNRNKKFRFEYVLSEKN